MYEITQFIVSDNKNVDSGLIIGGNKAYVSKWPINQKERSYCIFSL